MNREDLHPYQNRAVEFIKEKERCALFLDMGLGKTVSTLTAISDMQDSFTCSKVLVIAPLRVANNVWKQEVNKWEHLNHLRISVCTGSDRERRSALMRDDDIYVINRENVVWLVNLYKTLGKWPFRAIVIDESSSFKNSASKRFRALRKTLPLTNQMILLTGTPTPNGLLDLWSQMYLIDMGERLGKTKTGYKQRFFDADYMGYSFEPKKGSEKKIHSLISDVVLSMKAEDYIDVPEKINLFEKVSLPPKIMKAYKDFEKNLFLELDDGEELEAVNAAVLANKLLQFSNGAIYVDDTKRWSEIHTTKLDVLEEIIDENQGENILLAYSYRSDLERIKKRFPQAVTIDRDSEAIDAWNRGEVSLLLAHPACLHPSTKVLTEFRGWVSIKNVRFYERVFDGIEFVSHQGSFLSGKKTTIEKMGIRLTPTHKLLIDNEWIEAKHVQDSKDFRKKALYTYTGNDKYLKSMLPLRKKSKCSFAKCEKSKFIKKRILRLLHKRHFSQHDIFSFLANMGGYVSKNTKPKFKKLSRLWWTGNICLQRMGKFYKFLSRYVSFLQREPNNRTHRQLKGLLQRKLQMDYNSRTTVEQKKQPHFKIYGRKNAFGRILQKIKNKQSACTNEIKSWYESRRSGFRLSKLHLSQKPKITQTYDLVNSGPRNRFLIKNKRGEVFVSHNSCGHGLNLQDGGSLLVFFGLPWSLELYLQTVARLHRQGQKRPVRVVHVGVEGTIDDDVIDVLGSKDATQDRLLTALKDRITG